MNSKIIQTFIFSVPIFLLIIASFFSGCENNPTEITDLTDDEYIQSVIGRGYDNSTQHEDNLMSQEYIDLNDGGAIGDYLSQPLNPYDSLLRWGRKKTGVNRNINITNIGDTLKDVIITTTFTGNLHIIGLINGIQDTAIKPYTETMLRKAVFKRVAYTPKPRFNWRVFQVSILDGETTQPQVGSSQVQITKVELYKNSSGSPTYTFLGPDFQNNIFTTILFGGTGIPQFDRNDQVLVKIYTTSQQTEVDYVAFHWCKNTFGFHRIPFVLESQTGTGPYNRIYSKSFTIYPQHYLGVFNGYFSASTRESLFDNNPQKFASDLIGIPYKTTK